MHLGPEFYLGTGVASLAPNEGPPFPSSAIAKAIFAATGSRPESGPEHERTYQLWAQGEYPPETHFVGHCKIKGSRYVFVFGSTSPGIFKTELPEHVIWRLHMGHLIQDTA